MRLNIGIVLFLVIISAINCFIHSPINRRISRIDIKLLDQSGIFKYKYSCIKHYLIMYRSEQCTGRSNCRGINNSR